MTESSSPKVQIKIVNEGMKIDLHVELLQRTQPRVLRDLRYTTHHPQEFQKFIATHGDKIVGHLSAKIFGRTGWLAAAQISEEYQRKGIFNNLRIKAEQWLLSKEVEQIRVAIASDSLNIRNMFERKKYSPIAFSIEPNKYINPDEVNKSSVDHFSVVTDHKLYNKFVAVLEPLDKNIMIDSMYVPLDKDIWHQLVQEKRVYTDLKQDTFIVLSPNYVPMTFQGFVVSNSAEKYELAALALEAFAAMKDATEVIAHAPSRRNATLGLTKAGFSWSNPYSVVVYQKS